MSIYWHSNLELKGAKEDLPIFLSPLPVPQSSHSFQSDPPHKPLHSVSTAPCFPSDLATTTQRMPSTPLSCLAPLDAPGWHATCYTYSICPDTLNSTHLKLSRPSVFPAWSLVFPLEHQWFSHHSLGPYDHWLLHAFPHQSFKLVPTSPLFVPQTPS